MHKAECKDDFIKFVAPFLEMPITQKDIELSFNYYVGVIAEEGEICYHTMRRWQRLGSGMSVSTVEVRLKERPCDSTARVRQRVKYLRSINRVNARQDAPYT